MTHARWDRIKDIFNAALGVPQADRPALLDRLCADDAELRREVESLLEARTISIVRTGGAADALGDLTTASITDPHAADRVGMTIHRYKLLQIIGEGGFGTVYLAEQTEPVRRRVALKVIKPGMDSRAIVARFEAERQALAMMDHPHIARVLDGGATPLTDSGGGLPYFVMEYVVGDPVIAFADAHALSISERLDLFQQICSAVQHAHTKGIIHRDLKPGNVIVSMVDGKAFAKVIDFGIAKATGAAGGRLTDKTFFTEHRQLIGTPEYMSPEQAEGSLDIDTRTDVYALGVLLYELLTGTTPIDSHRLGSAAFGEMQRIIREEEPLAPSMKLSRSLERLASTAAMRRAEPAKLSAMVKGELDWIVLKALEKDRSRRYETATALADDVKRHMAGEPVVAAPPSRAYRLRKFVRKNKGAVTIGAVMLLGLAGTTAGLVSAEQSARVAIRLRDEAEWSAYSANLGLAQKAMDSNSWPAAREYLVRCPEQKRGWEWTFMSRLANSVIARYPTSNNAISPDGRLILECAGRTARIRTLDGEILRELSASPPYEYRGGVFSNDGSACLLRMHNRTSEQRTTLASLREGSPTSLTVPGVLTRIAPDGSSFIVQDPDGYTVHFADGSIAYKADSQTQYLHYSSSDRLLAMQRDGDLVRVNLRDRSAHILASDANAGMVKVHPISGRWAYNTIEGVTILNREDEVLAVANAPKHQMTGMALEWLGDQQLLTASFTGDIVVLDLDGKEVFRLAPPPLHGWAWMDVAVSPDGLRFAATGPYGSVHIVDIGSRKITQVIGEPDDNASVRFAPDSRSVFVERMGTVVEYDLEGGIISRVTDVVGEFRTIAAVSDKYIVLDDFSEYGTQSSVGLSVLPRPLGVVIGLINASTEAPRLVAQMLSDRAPATWGQSAHLPGGDRRASARGRSIIVERISDGVELLRISAPSEVDSVSLSNDSTRLLVLLGDGSLFVLDSRNAADHLEDARSIRTARALARPIVDALLAGSIPWENLERELAAREDLDSGERLAGLEMLHDEIRLLDGEAGWAIFHLTANAKSTQEGRSAVADADLPPRVRERAMLRVANWEWVMTS